jgi:ATP-dependent DNA helicase RecQ
MALTATATEKVREDIVKRLDLWNYNSFTAGFDRKNITIIVRELSKKDDKINKVVEILNKTKWVWIIYCSSRKAVKEVYDTLTLNNVKAGIYTWAMTPVNREKEQNSFMNDDYKVIVATNAFWMWIDKKDIRFVIHYNLPWSIENYYQEVWRAWRDWKQSFWIILASFADTKIQEFFIENTYPSKNEILQLYDYFFKGIPEWWWKNIAILKTYATIAKESKIDSDMKVWSALKILEKYWILRRWVSDSMNDGEFRGRWIILIQEKRKHSNLLIDWNHQMLLKDEAYYKLDQIKKLLFYPSCRKRFILKYFWDKEDLDVLPKNCARCDFCIEKKNLDKIEIKDYVNTSVFALVLDVVKNNDSKIWVVMMTKFLRGSIDAKIKQWRLDEKENYWALSDLNSDLIQAVIESLISLDYLYKSDWKYPLLWITDAWKIAIIRNEFLVDDNKELQQFIRLKLWDKLDKESQKLKKPKKEKNATYNETLKLFKKWISLKDISQQRELGLQTIEWHIVKLYSLGNILLTDILNFTTFWNLNIIKDTINNDLNWDIWVLKTIKDTIKQKNISYFEIKIAIAMIQKKDL